ncbi:MAG TPA: NUDIX domain-containing protein [Armatimonadota bacterium]|nr:NUDIX domain-containing protein [Armatimonadota bacterium]
MATEKSAGAVIYKVTEDGNLLFLLLQPGPGKPWGFPKGKIDYGETEEEAARREIAEESGLTEIELDTDFRLVIHYTYRHGKTIVRKDVVYFVARTLTSQIRISWEHVAYRWATLHEALELVVYENARNTLRKAFEHIKKAHGVLDVE